MEEDIMVIDAPAGIQYLSYPIDKNYFLQIDDDLFEVKLMWSGNIFVLKNIDRPIFYLDVFDRSTSSN